MAVEAWFTEDDLREIADGRSFDRGVGYRDAVVEIRHTPAGVWARVRGTSTYTVELSGCPDLLDGACRCPYGAEGAFCKHCVAVGLALLDGVVPEPAEPTADPAALRSWLRTLPHDDLVDLAVAMAHDYPAIHAALMTRAADGGALDVVDGAALLEPLYVDEYLDDRAARRYADAAGHVLDVLAALADSDPVRASKLYRRAVEQLSAQAAQADDSSGEIASAAAAAYAGYGRVCARAGEPAPAVLAGWLADLVLDDQWVLDVDLTDYADALGSAGVAAFQACLDARPSSRRAVTALRLRDQCRRLRQATG
ncbi:hypothetical protein GCM10010124_21940 [Pilimelia terevasa]|uniref:SWIM-type domain-containing protein n=1 Tax=Pilimelia terevasa TaxID=53372 RepID=A0A8J3BQI6_9ACTN|nr:hypothetical protein [Pilimelia terevasa]GGK28829.1 hypothetical protein GCM10010124_21940 [Pilimelia terevasa]